MYNLLKLRVPGKPGPLEFDEKIARGFLGGGMVTLKIELLHVTLSCMVLEVIAHAKSPKMALHVRG